MHFAVLAVDYSRPVVRVVDGDTIVVSIDGKDERVRLIGVDTPETVHPRKAVEYFGKEASEFTKRLLTAKRVILRGEVGGQDRDRYGRLLRYVFLEDGTFVNAEIIKTGHGHAYTRYPFAYMDEFREYERHAREHSIGLWQGVDKPPVAGGDRTAILHGAGYLASSKSSVYHRLDCIWASRIKTGNMITFKNDAAALDGGYRPCSVCKPPAENSARDRSATSR